MTDDEIENARPIAQLLDAHGRLQNVHAEIGEAIELIIERDVKRGLYKLKAGPHRKKEIKLLADQGLSNRQIAKVLGISKDTVQRDLNGANAPPTGANAPPKGPQYSEDEVKKRVALAYEEKQKEIDELTTTIKEIAKQRDNIEKEVSSHYNENLIRAVENAVALAREDDEEQHQKEIEQIKHKYEEAMIKTEQRSDVIQVIVQNLIEVTKVMTNEQKVHIVLEICEKLEITPIMVASRYSKLRQEPGLIHSIKLT